MPGDEEEVEIGVKYLDPRIIETPSIALGQATKEVMRMGKIVEENLELASKAFKNKDEKMTSEVFSQEKVVNRLERDIVEYLVELSNAPLTDEQHTQVNVLINVVNDIERVGDHADNIAELSQEVIDERLYFSDEAMEEFDIISNKSQEVFRKALEAFTDVDFDKAREVLRLEEEIDVLEGEYRTNHIDRLNKLLCQPSSGVIFLDLLSNLERVSDHSSNIALYVLDQLKEQ